MKTKLEMKTEENGIEGLDRALNGGFPDDSGPDKVLIIDDSSTISEVVQLFLSQSGYETFAVGIQFLSLWTSFKGRWKNE